MKLKHYLRGLGLGIIVSTLIVSAGKNGRAAELSNEEIKEKAKQLGMVDENEMLLSQAQSLAKEAAKNDDEKKSVKKTEDEKADHQDKVSEDAISGNSPSASSDDIRNEGLIAGSFLGAGAGSTETSQKQAQNEPRMVEVQEKQTEKEVSEEEKTEKEKTVTVAELEDKNSDAGKASENRDTVNTAETDTAEVLPSPAKTPVSITVVRGESSTAVAKKLEKAGVITDAAQFDSYLCLNGFDRRLVTGAHTIPAGSSIREIAEIITGR